MIKAIMQRSANEQILPGMALALWLFPASCSTYGSSCMISAECGQSSAPTRLLRWHSVSVTRCLVSHAGLSRRSLPWQTTSGTVLHYNRYAQHMAWWYSLRVRAPKPWLVKYGLMSHRTHCRTYWGWVVTGGMTQPAVSKHRRKIGS